MPTSLDAFVRKPKPRDSTETDSYWISQSAKNYILSRKRYLQMEARAPTTTLVAVVVDNTGRGGGGGTGVATLETAEGVLAPSPVPHHPVGVEGAEASKAEVHEAALWRRSNTPPPPPPRDALR